MHITRQSARVLDVILIANAFFDHCIYYMYYIFFEWFIIICGLLPLSFVFHFLVFGIELNPCALKTRTSYWKLCAKSLKLRNKNQTERFLLLVRVQSFQLHQQNDYVFMEISASVGFIKISSDLLRFSTRFAIWKSSWRSIVPSNTLTHSLTYRRQNQLPKTHTHSSTYCALENAIQSALRCSFLQKQIKSLDRLVNTWITFNGNSGLNGWASIRARARTYPLILSHSCSHNRQFCRTISK